MRNVTAAGILLTVAICLSSPARPSGQGCPSELHSAGGDVSFGSSACSPNGKLKAREVEPKHMGRIAIMDAAGSLVREIRIGEIANPLKGLAWTPDSKLLAVMYHHDHGASYIALYDVASGARKVRIPISEPYNYIKVNADGRSLTVRSKDGRSHQVPIP